jgi:hypothetical protein
MMLPLPRALLLPLLALLQQAGPTEGGVLCGGTACVRAVTCPPEATNATQWTLKHKAIDGQQATNLILLHPHDGPPSAPGTPSQSGAININCAGANIPCHMWGPGFGDRNGFFLLDGAPASGFRVKSWPLTKSVPVGPTQLKPGLCLTALNGANPPDADSQVVMAECSDKALTFKLSAPGNTLVVQTKVPVAAALCLGAPPPPPQPPPGRPDHWFSCTLNLEGTCSHIGGEGISYTLERFVWRITNEICRGA